MADTAASSNVSRHTIQARSNLVFTDSTPGEAAAAAAQVHPEVSRTGKDVQDHISVATPLALQFFGKIKDPRLGAVLNELKRMTLEEQVAHSTELEKLTGTFSAVRYVLERINIVLLGGRSEAAIGQELQEYLLKHIHPGFFSAINPIHLFNALFKEAILELRRYSGGMSQSAIVVVHNSDHNCSYGRY